MRNRRPFSATTGVYLPSGNDQSCLPVRAFSAYVALAQRREVDDVADHRRRAGDLPVRVEAPALGAGRRVERVEAPAVRAREHGGVPHCRRCVHVSARRVRPDAAFRSSRRTSRPCRRSSRCTRGRRRAPASSRSARARRGGAAPRRATGACPPRVEAVQVPVVRADVQLPAGRCDRALDRAADVRRQSTRAVVGVERPHVAVPVADVEPAVDQERRALRRADRRAASGSSRGRRRTRRPSRRSRGRRSRRCTAAC